MSIEPINPIGPQTINPIEKTSTETPSPAKPKEAASETSQVDQSQNISINNEMSTENFLVLKAQNGDQDPFANLDTVIEKMQNNIEEMGKALESLVEKIQKVSEMSVGLQLLTKTFEAIDRYRNGPGSE
jgi:ribosome-associated translation inhibitor RaiA